MTRLVLPRLPLLLAVLLAAVMVRPASAAAASCSGSACTGQDPYTTGCAEGRTVAGSAPILDGAGNRVGELVLYWSARCQANWGQASFDDGNPPSTPPVTVSVQGSVMSTYDAPPVNFTTSASGSPVWGNMVYSPGCAYSTVIRGADKGEAVQADCLPPGGGQNPNQPNQPSQPPVTTGGWCQGTLCNGLDPYAGHCSGDASVAGSSQLVDSSGASIGTIKLYFSSACQSNWGQVDFNDGNPPTTPPVSVTVVGTDGASPGDYDSHPVEYVTTGSGSPVWGNMVYSPGCAVAYASRGRASGRAVQSGCPPPGGAPPASSSDTLTATGREITVYGGLEVNNVVAGFSVSNAAAQPSDFTVTIEWGDGTQSAGTVSGSPANFEVHGDHIYPSLGGAEAQGYQAMVTIRSRSGGTATAYTPIEIVSALPGASIGGGSPTTGPGPSDQPGISAGDKAGSIASSGFSTFVSGAGCAVGSEIPFLDVLVCADAGKNAVELGAAIADPPDSGYRHVFHVTSPRPRRIPRQCPHLARSACLALHAAVVRFARASARADVLAEALGVTANRFGGAKRAHNRSAERLQRTAARRYFAHWAAAQAARRAAGHALALLLLRDHLDHRVTAADVIRGRSRLMALYGVSREDLTRLRRNGLIGTHARLLALLQRDLKWAPSPGDTTLSAALGG